MQSHFIFISRDGRVCPGQVAAILQQPLPNRHFEIGKLCIGRVRALFQTQLGAQLHEAAAEISH